jgi:hypothetical protein
MPLPAQYLQGDGWEMIICESCNGEVDRGGACRPCSESETFMTDGRQLTLLEVERRVPQHLRYDGDFDNLVKAYEEDR